MDIFTFVCCHGNSLQYIHKQKEAKSNTWCVANLPCESQELKPKVETNSSFLVLHSSLGVDTTLKGTTLKSGKFSN